MTIRKIALMGNSILNKKAELVTDLHAPELATLIDDMRETLDDIKANGLAAPQVHVSKRVIVYRIVQHQIPEGSSMKPVDWQVLINPQLKITGEEKFDIWERCLSVPQLHGIVTRYRNIVVTAEKLGGGTIEIEASGFHAMLLQHEIDHLDGIVYPMRMSQLNTLSYNSELGDTGFFMPRDLSEFE